MPGIHVPSLGKLDWVERGNETVLTIPGAYWLCHKKHIYKFTFKWHKSLRNTERFAYPKELTKVIRRIIKSQPRQGQQFGTRHLLVTYNHSAWMRQDKMFAMLKFRERTDATAFPHAFVLTVQTVNESPGVQRTEGSSSRRTASQTAKDDEPVQEIDGGSREQNRGALDPETRNYNSKEKEKSKDSERVRSSVQSAGKKSSSSLSEAKNEREKDAAGRWRKSTRNVENLPGPKCRTRRSNVEKVSDKLAPDSPSEKGIGADLADLPYQYIIEKEIENSKGTSSGKRGSNRSEEKSSPGPRNRESDLPGRSLPRSPRGAQVETARSADITDLVMEGLMFTIRQDQDTVTVVEQKTKLEVDEVLENSVKAETKEGEKCLLNSNLLGLENLITKIEMPELRSKNNNEESSRSPLAITSEPFINRSFGFSSPGLASNYAISPLKYKVNSSLVESPIKPKEVPPRGESIERSPITEKIPLVKINLSNVRDVLSERLCYEGQHPELMQARKDMEMHMNVASNHKKEEKKSIRTEDELEEEEVEDLELKYDEKDDWESDKNEGDGEAISELLPAKAQQDFPLDDPRPTVASKSESPSQILTEHEKIARSTPRVISNEIVTSAQIPPALQEALNHKRFKRKRLSFESDTSSDRKAENPSEEAPSLESAPENKSSTFDHESPNEKVTENPRLDSLNSAPSSPVIDITEEFEREFASEKSRKLPNRRKSLRVDTNKPTVEPPPEVRLDMWKFMHDMTRGAKVVVHRLDLTNFPRNVASGSSPVKCTSAAHYVTES